MYCHLCLIEGSPNHENSSGHRAARELISTAVDRLANHVAASADCLEGDFLETDKTAKTPEAVGYCDCCNAVVPINEHSTHIRMKSHALALLNEQRFEELVQAYLSVGDKKQDVPSEQADDGVFVDEIEAAKTYTCNICSLQVPQVFKLEHERGTRHNSSRILALAAARRASRLLSSYDSPKNCEGNFTEKMMKKLLKAYIARYEDKENEVKENKAVEEDKEEPQPTPTEPTRLTAKEYFTDILPYLSYVGTFFTIIIGHTEFVTIQIGNETLSVHVNNFNGLHNVEGNGGYYMNCRLCDGLGTCYSCVGHQDKSHVMSLGHIMNVFSPIEGVHLIKKVEDSYSFCALCNLRISVHYVEHHILKDACHTIALTEALRRGKEYKENKEELKIRIYVPSSQKMSGFIKPNQNKWNFGIPQQPRSSGTLFGSGQTAGFGNSQTQNTGFGNSQNTAFGSNQNIGFGSSQNTGFGSIQNSGFGSTQSPFGGNQNNFGSVRSISSGQPAFRGSDGSIFGTNQNNFGNAQTTNLSTSQIQSQPSVFNTSTHQSAFGGTQTARFGTPRNQSSIFNSVPNNQNTSVSGQNQQSIFNGAPTNQNTSVFGHSQTSAGVAQKSGIFGTQAAQNSSSSINTGASQQSNTGFGNSQSIFGSSQTAQISTTNSGASQTNIGFGGAQKKTGSNTTTIGSGLTVQSNDSQQNNTGFGNSQKNQGIFGFAPNTLTQVSSVMCTIDQGKACNSPEIKSSLKSPTPIWNQTSKASNNSNFSKKPSTIISQLNTGDIKQNTAGQHKDGNAQEKGTDSAIQTKSETIVPDNKNKPIVPPKRWNYSSSSSSD